MLKNLKSHLMKISIKSQTTAYFRRQGLGRGSFRPTENRIGSLIAQLFHIQKKQTACNRKVLGMGVH